MSGLDIQAVSALNRLHMASNLPIMAICYGQQTTAVQLGGTVEGGHAAEFGRAEIDIKEKSALFDGV